MVQYTTSEWYQLLKMLRSAQVNIRAKGESTSWFTDVIRTSFNKREDVAKNMLIGIRNARNLECEDNLEIDLKNIFFGPFEDIPLAVNIPYTYIKTIVQWRLKIGR